MWTWRRMEKISWKEHKINEEVMGTIGEEALICTIREKQRKWIGHTLRGDSLLRTISNEKWREGKQEEDQESKTDDAGLDDGRWIRKDQRPNSEWT